MGTSGEVRDRLINHLFGSGLTLAAVLSLQRVDGDVADRLRDVVEQLDAAIDEIRYLAFADAVAEGVEQQQSLLQAVPIDFVRARG